MSIAQLEQEALKLSMKERASLAQKLLNSLDEADDEASDLLCAGEAERRMEEFKRGEVKAIASEEVFSKIRNKFK
jgi:putative addiction module component (TIGR02574 family)